MLETVDKPDTRPAAVSEVAEAMNKVLTAERDALAEIAECRTQAERILEAARREARLIDERAERLARDIHARTGPFAAAQGRRIAEQGLRRGHEHDGPQALAHAVERLVARMTGSGDA